MAHWRKKLPRLSRDSCRSGRAAPLEVNDAKDRRVAESNSAIAARADRGAERARQQSQILAAALQDPVPCSVRRAMRRPSVRTTRSK